MDNLMDSNSVVPFKLYLRSRDHNLNYDEIYSYIADTYRAPPPMVVARPLAPSLGDKLLRALHLYQDRFPAGNILAQVWVPTRFGDERFLNTSDQPFLTNPNMSGYREASRAFIFATEKKEGFFLGLPGRVFTTKVPEWTGSVKFYSEAEFLRLRHAADHEVGGSIAMPIFDEGSIDDSFCCAVMELVTTEEKDDFDREMDNICHVLQDVGLSSTMPHVLPSQNLSKNQKVALPEVKDILRTICGAYHLPLALAWIPCTHTEVDGKIRIRPRRHGVIIGPNEKHGLCIVDESVCYWKEQNMYGFVHACAGTFLEVGQGMAGTAFEWNEPFSKNDVKEYHISEYPLVHHARKLGLRSGVAFNMRNNYNDDYILEFFLPMDMKEFIEQQALMSNISNTIDAISMSLKEGLDRESYTPGDVNDVNIVPEATGNVVPPPKKARQRRKNEKDVSLSVMKPYFSKSLKKAAKIFGVSSTTLKKKCRIQGLSQWPSRHTKSVNQSIQKAEDAIALAGEMEEELKIFFEPNKRVGVMVAKVNRALEKLKNVVVFVRKVVEEYNSNPTKNGDVASTSTNQQEFNYPSKDWIEGQNTSLVFESIPWITSPTSSSLDVSEGDNRGDMPEGGSINIEEISDEKGKGLESMVADGMMEYSQGQFSQMTRSLDLSDMEIFLMKNDVASSERKETTFTFDATYKGNTTRFDFNSSLGCYRLYAEVGERFKLEIEQFSISYPDDENEWIGLVTEKDFVECFEILERLGNGIVKLLVHDVVVV